jgi:hypothetical protein
LSKQRKDEEYNVTVDLQLPRDYVNEAEIRLVAACLGDLLKRVIREIETMKE